MQSSLQNNNLLCVNWQIWQESEIGCGSALQVNYTMPNAMGSLPINSKAGMREVAGVVSLKSPTPLGRIAELIRAASKAKRA